jgi:hypothetical protein
MQPLSCLLHILSFVRYRVKMEINQQQQHMLPSSLVMDVM